jgi:ABC-type microcin C transport system permease subunit YejB
MTFDLIFDVLRFIGYAFTAITMTFLLVVVFGGGYLLAHDRHREQFRLYCLRKLMEYTERRHGNEH